MIPRMLNTARTHGTEIVGDAIGLAAICVMIVSALMF